MNGINNIIVAGPRPTHFIRMAWKNKGLREKTHRRRAEYPIIIGLSYVAPKSLMRHAVYSRRVYLEFYGVHEAARIHL